MSGMELLMQETEYSTGPRRCQYETKKSGQSALPDGLFEHNAAFRDLNWGKKRPADIHENIHFSWLMWDFRGLEGT